VAADKRELAHGDAAAGVKIHRGRTLNAPSGIGE
jgi:hypothetical protein